MGRPQANEPRDIVSRERHRATRERKGCSRSMGGGNLSAFSSERAADGNSPPHAISLAIWSTIKTGPTRGVWDVRFHTASKVAGALAVIVYGIEGIPDTWLETLRAKDLIDACLF